MGKAMTIDSLVDTMNRLDACSDLLYMLCESAGSSSISDKSIGAVCDLLDSIIRDFKAGFCSVEEVPA